jgi:glycosyltransferase involved in cell wall biosynthesis
MTSKKNYQYAFTVFTPIFNRAHTLHKVYDSLRAQTFKDFEWLIVDDGSTDDTKVLIDKWRSAAKFPIRYIYQENRGKHVAFNRGVKQAKGELFLTLDSDDACVPEALREFKYHWDSIPPERREGFSGVSALCQDEHGNLVGKEFPSDVVDSSPIVMNFKYNIYGDKWGFHRTEVLRRYPIPEIAGEKFIPEGVIWNRIGLKYKVRFINEKLEIVEYQRDGLSASSAMLRVKNPLGSMLYYKEFIVLPLPIRKKIESIINYIRFSFHAQTPLRQIIFEGELKALVAVLLVFGWILFRIDTFKLRYRP